jgi:hypothetical protein
MAGSAQTDSGRRWSRWRIAAWGAAAAVLLLPLIAMQFTDEVNWGPGDFALAAALVIGVGMSFELALRRTGSHAYRAAAAVALAAAFTLAWANLAVGVIGSEDNPANLMVWGVLAVGIFGALAARFQPRGMARALAATALAQVIVDVLTLLSGLGFAGPITAFFAALWLLSAWLFRKAAREQVRLGAVRERA